MIWIDFESFCVKNNGCLVVTLLPGCITLRVESFSPSFKLWVELNVLHIDRLWERLGCLTTTIILICLTIGLTCCTVGCIGSFLSTE